MKRLIPFAAFLLVVGCDKPTKDSKQAEPTPAVVKKPLTEPADVVAAYYDSLWGWEFEKAYHLVSKADRANKSLEDYQRDAASANEKFAKAKRSFAVHGTKVEGDTARVYLDVTQPDLTRIQQKLLSEFVSEGKLPTASGLQDQLEAEFAKPDVPMATLRQEVLLVKEGDLWRLDFDWDREKPDRPVPEKSRPEPGPTADGQPEPAEAQK